MSADAVAALVDEAAIRAVLADAARRLDAADPRWVDTFTPDGIFEVVDAATATACTAKWATRTSPATWLAPRSHRIDASTS